MIVREFLPSGALTNARLDSLYRDALSSWSRDWFSGAQASLQMASATRGARVVPGEASQNSASARALAHVDLSAIGKRRLLEAALDVQLEGLQMADADRELTDLFLERVIGDLVAKLEIEPPARNERSVVVLDLALGGRAIGTISVSSDALTARLRKAMKPLRKPSSFSCSRLEAAGSTQLVVEGVLGTAELKIRELAELAPGDVVILGCQVGDRAALRLVGGDHPIHWGRLTPDVDHNAVTISAATKGQA